ncbi:hypothetical protein MRX96_043000 [Rhipicephalus microplus]
MTMPSTGQSAVQRGVALYRSCEDLLHGHRDHLASVREALREAGITWPRRPAEADVLHTVLATSLRLGWDVLFRFVPLQSPRSRLTVNPGRTIVVVFKRKMASQFTRRGREYFSLLRSSMLPHDAIEMDKTSTTIKHRLLEVTALDELTSPLLSAAYNVPTTIPESTDHMMDIQKIRLSRASTHVFVSWYTVQVAALMANRNLIANFYGGQSRRALSFQVAFCLGLAYAVTGPVIFSRYNRHVPRAAMRQDASHLVLGVCSWAATTALGLVTLSPDTGYIESHAANTATMGGTMPPLTEDSLVANLRKVSSSVNMRIRDDDGLRAHHDSTVMPYALSFPHFDVQLKTTVNMEDSGASNGPFGDNTGVNVAETHLLGAAVDAYEQVRADVDTAKLPGLEAYTDLQILFMALCFAKCRGSSARNTPPSACNLPLMYSVQFARAFECAVGTPMNQVNQCPMA